MQWKLPPRIKVLEALGCIADKRIEVNKNRACVKSSNGTKTYNVEWDGKNRITSTDNGSVYKGYLGYPSIAFLMLKDILPFNRKIASVLKGIEWKKLNEKFKNYYKTELVVKKIAKQRGISSKEIDAFVKNVMDKIKQLKLLK